MKHISIPKVSPMNNRVLKPQHSKHIVAFVTTAVAAYLNAAHVNAAPVVSYMLSAQQMMDRIVVIEEIIIPDLIDKLDPDITDANGISHILNQVENDLTDVQEALMGKQDVDEVKKREFVRIIDLIEEELEMLKSQV